MLALKADLHVHSCLSPCADGDMNPLLVMDKAQQLGINLIALADHHHSGNVPSFLARGQKLGIWVMPAMEVETAERVHLVCLFDYLTQLEQWQSQVLGALPPGDNPGEIFGPQLLVNQEGQVTGEVKQLLLNPLKFSVSEVVERVKDLGGLVIPAHLDRPGHSLVFRMGLEAARLFPAVEISNRMEPAIAREIYGLDPSQAVLVSSDAHFLADLTSPRITLNIAEVTIKELKHAFRGREGRWVEVT